MDDDYTTARTILMDPDAVLAHLGREVRIVRESRGLSRARFAKRCGLSVHTIKKLEGGRGPQPRLDTMIRLANGLDLPLVDLVAHVDPRFPDEHDTTVGATNLWLADLAGPERELVLALVRVLMRSVTGAAETQHPYGCSSHQPADRSLIAQGHDPAQMPDPTAPASRSPSRTAPCSSFRHRTMMTSIVRSPS